MGILFSITPFFKQEKNMKSLYTQICPKCVCSLCSFHKSIAGFLSLYLIKVQENGCYVSQYTILNLKKKKCTKVIDEMLQINTVFER